jgi:two-component system sensor histidine kinase RegB
MQEELAKKDRLASLATLAAGAAHELNTPLGTIAVVATELERYANRTTHDPALAADSRLVRQEVNRCREILRRMSVEGAEPAGEAATSVTVADLLTTVAHALPDASLRIDAPHSLPLLRVPRHAVEQSLIALAKNAIEASPAGSPVHLAAARSGKSIRFSIVDSGAGMSPETLRHAGEPFFTSKEPGKGMGLGIFLVRTLADQLGGRSELTSSLGEGTSAALELPLQEPVAR